MRLIVLLRSCEPRNKLQSTRQHPKTLQSLNPNTRGLITADFQVSE